ncbi:MAG: ABC transporter permease [Planctomycetes bacterium]|nr:ABC transporter permease [Planctomycetota bacterium]
MSRKALRLLLAAYLVVGLAAAAGWIGGGWAEMRDGFESLPPGAAGLLGTDHLGRDVLARVLQGTWIALVVGGMAAGLAVVVGAALGLLAGWHRGWADEALVWLSGVVAAVPGILLILAVGFVLERGLASVCLAIAVATWVGVFRLVRAEVLKLKQLEFVAAARASGAGAGRILLRHLLPNLRGLLSVQFSLRFVYAVKAEVLVSFLGVGLLDQPSWGRMIARAQYDLGNGLWWPLAAATAALGGLVLSVQLLAEPETGSYVDY